MNINETSHEPTQKKNYHTPELIALGSIPAVVQANPNAGCDVGGVTGSHS